MSDVHYGLAVKQKRLREAIGPLAACGQSGGALRTTHLLAEVTCGQCRTMVDSGGVAMWEITAEKIEDSYRREVRALRRELVPIFAKVVLSGVAVAALAWAVTWVLAGIWP